MVPSRQIYICYTLLDFENTRDILIRDLTNRSQTHQSIKIKTSESMSDHQTSLQYFELEEMMPQTF